MGKFIYGYAKVTPNVITTETPVLHFVTGQYFKVCPYLRGLTNGRKIGLFNG